MDIATAINDFRNLASKFVIALVLKDVDGKPHGYVADLARKIGIANSNISMWKGNKRSSLDLETIKKVGGYFGMDLSEIAKQVGMPHLSDAFWLAQEYPHLVAALRNMSADDVQNMLIVARVNANKNKKE